ncbi:protein of unknown function-containing protein [Forsythia ovata]|uniref:Protein ENHANCED DISEASE RESISTANCE 2 C-terminal domain-containing protein n=1 Tax=Forsythia ovata TaxID=205694 RepID=A0ABD1WS73_9LAMI
MGVRLWCGLESDVFRNSIFKIINKIVNGQWIMKTTVKNYSACLLGKVLNYYYHKGPNYLKIYVDIGSSTIATAIFRVALGCVTMDMDFLVEARSEKELPEKFWFNTVSGDLSMEAEKLLDLSEPIDVAFLDAAVAAFYCTRSKEERIATDVVEGIGPYQLVMSFGKVVDNQMADATQVEDKLSEEISENTPDEKQETLEEMLSRHRDNGSTEQGNCNEKGSRAEQKAKKKQVDEEISKLSTKLKERHAEELASLGYSSSGAGNGRGNLNNLIKAIAGVSVTNQADRSKPSKGIKRREKNRKLPGNKEYKKSRVRS